MVQYGEIGFYAKKEREKEICSYFELVHFWKEIVVFLFVSLSILVFSNFIPFSFENFVKIASFRSVFNSRQVESV